MILTRLGNKRAVANDIICHFPAHKAFIDMFFGAGGIFFYKPLSHFNFCNDIDDDVFNLWSVLQNDKDELIRQIELLPISDTLFQHFRKSQYSNPITKAVRFIMLSNFGYMGKTETMRFGQAAGFEKKAIFNKIEDAFRYTQHCRFMCCDFRKMLSKIQFRDKNEYSNSFIYADPPYLGQTHTYQNGFKEQDTIDLFDVLIKSKMRFALSEFDNPFILDLAKQHNLEVITIGERQNMKNRRTEILVVNYESPALYSLFRNQEHSLSLV
jgi:DNA adenine methylase